MSVNPNELYEILSNFPDKYGNEKERQNHDVLSNKNVDVANLELIKDMKARLKEHIVHYSSSDSSLVVNSLPELTALDPDLVADHEKKRRKLRKALN